MSIVKADNRIYRTAENPAVTAEQVLIRGDLTALKEDERIKYYADVCKSVGLNPLTKPFEYITLNGKLRLYALKDCTDQLRSIHHVSVTEMTESEREGVFIVKCKVQNGEGRTDMATGAVNIANLCGEVLANALMKAETKAKRRATLSICGLGMLDETEVDDIPFAAKQSPAFKVPSPPKQVDIVKDDPSTPVELTPFKDEGIAAWAERFIVSTATAKNLEDLDRWGELNEAYLDKAMAKAKNVYTKIAKAMTAKQNSFKPKEDPISTGADIAKYQSAVGVDPATMKPRTIAGPDIEKDYEGWLAWAFDQINTAEDGGWLEQFSNETIGSAEGALFPPDYTDLMTAVTRKQNALNED